MKTIKKYLLGVAAVAALTGCKDKMIELNTNPGIIMKTNPEYMFFGATSDGLYRPGNGYQQSRVNGLGTVMQYAARPGNNYYSDPTKVDQRNPMPGMFWDRYFTGAGQKLNSLVDYIDQKLDATGKAQYKDLRAKAKIVQTFMAWKVFDAYGAMPYKEGLKGAQGTFLPKYDLYQDMYKGLDDTLKLQIASLRQPLDPANINAGAFDGFYGIVVTPKQGGGSSQAIRTDDKARGLWIKFANALRVKMALRVAGRDAAFLASVVADVEATPGSIMSSVEDGCQYYYPYDIGGPNNDTDNQIAYFMRSSLSFINSMKVENDPRLPIWIRPNGNDTLLYRDNGYRYDVIAADYPDSLVKMRYYNSKTAFLGDLNWNGRLEQGNVWQGQSTNPASFSLNSKLPGLTWTGSWYSQVINNPAGDADCIGPITGKVLFKGKTKTYQWHATSRLQARFFTIIWEGTTYSEGDTWKKGGIVTKDVRMTYKVLPYSDNCFTMALAADKLGKAIDGKSASAWYEEGVRASLKEAYNDALLVYIPICTAEDYPIFPPYNGTSEADRHLYEITPQMIDDYVASHPVAHYAGGIKEAVAVQAWLGMFQNPEEMWAYWKLTGYPRQLDYPFITRRAAEVGSITVDDRFKANDNDVDIYNQLPTVASFERPYNNSNQPLDWPRRSVVPTPNAANIQSYYNVQDALMKTDGFGSDWNKTSTRIWWDNQSTPVIGN